MSKAKKQRKKQIKKWLKKLKHFEIEPLNDFLKPI